MRAADPAVASAREELTLDEALHRVGECGYGQAYIFGLVGLALVASALQNHLTVFAALGPLREGLVTCTGTDAACAARLVQPLADVCGLDRAAWRWTDKSYSTTSEWDLVCGEAWKRNLIQAAFFTGWLLGGAGFGWLADEYGRRRALGAACAMAALFGAASALAPAFWWYVVVRGATGAGAAGVAAVASLIALEPVGAAWRGSAAMAAAALGAAGAATLPGLAWVLPHWRGETFAVAALQAAFLLLLLPSVPESPRWLLHRGRKGDATAALAAIASRNRSHLPDAPLADGYAVVAARRGLADIAANGRLRRRAALLLLAWLSASLVYTVVVLQVAELPGNAYLNVFFLFLVEPASLALAAAAAERAGRRATLAGALLQGGAAVVLCGLTRGRAQLALAVASRVGVAGGLGLAQVYSAELFPDTVRGAALNACNVAANLGGVAAPFLLWAGRAAGGRAHAHLLPLLVAGGLLTAAGAAAIALPETLGAPMLLTIQDMGTAATAPASGGRKRFGLAPLRQIFRSGRTGTAGGVQLPGDSMPLRSPSESMEEP